MVYENWCINVLVWWKRLRTARHVQELQLKFASHWIWYWFQCKTSIYCWVCLEPTRIHRNNGRLLRPLIFGKGLLIDNCLNAGRTFAISSMGISLNVDFRFWTLSIICVVCIGFVNQIFTGLTKMLTMYQHCLPIQCLMFMYGLDKNLNTEA